ncbi:MULTISPECIES: peptidase [unclassified Microbacterium]|uniref:peptidase n=1 Tax=unclassified Microbacterium TaxID=2609290 RepID=UPI000EAA49F2|nr:MULTISPECIES: peptidase [unclassified Microbacterium]MBT2485569.1 peptidase [Microbacterium sp. ISL-108]RKN68355.1 peptidase [Microbacterium sp. CGR2]
MNVVIDWFAFLQVFLAALVGATAIVTFYSLGLRLLVRSGRAPVVSPAEFTDAITVISEKELRRAAKQAAKAAKKSPLTDNQKSVALVGAYGCFTMCAVAVIAGILIIVVGH